MPSRGGRLAPVVDPLSAAWRPPRAPPPSLASSRSPRSSARGTVSRPAPAAPRGPPSASREPGRSDSPPRPPRRATVSPAPATASPATSLASPRRASTMGPPTSGESTTPSAITTPTASPLIFPESGEADRTPAALLSESPCRWASPVTSVHSTFATASSHGDTPANEARVSSTLGVCSRGVAP